MGHFRDRDGHTTECCRLRSIVFGFLLHNLSRVGDDGHPRNIEESENRPIPGIQNGCDLQSMLAVLAAHLTGFDPMQIALDQLHELVRGQETYWHWRRPRYWLHSSALLLAPLRPD